MSELQDRLANVGWCNTSDVEYQRLIFLWIEEATRTLEQLRSDVASLERVLASRTEHLV